MRPLGGLVVTAAVLASCRAETVPVREKVERPVEIVLRPDSMLVAADLQRGFVRLLAPGGETRWEWRPPDPPILSLAVGPDSLTHILTAKHIYSLTPRGSVARALEAPWSPLAKGATIVVCSDAQVVISDGQSRVRKLRANDTAWTYSERFAWPFIAPPRAAEDGNIYLLSHTHITALSSEGAKLWQAATHP